MTVKTRKILIAVVFILVLATPIFVTGTAERPPGRGPRVDRPTIGKPGKWLSGRFNAAAEGRVSNRKLTEREPPAPRNGRPVEKWEKWERGDFRKEQIKKDFTTAAQKMPPPLRPGGAGRPGGNGGAPPAAPPAGPARPAPAPPRPGGPGPR